MGTVRVNQQSAPVGLNDAGSTFQDLMVIEVFGDQLIVTLTDDADGLVIADAVRIARVEDIDPNPEIELTSDAENIEDNVGVVDFGSVQAGVLASKDFTISNTGTTPLFLDAVISVPANFSVLSPLGTTALQPGQNTTFTITMDTDVPGTFSGEVSIGSNDADENPFNFTIQGQVAPVINVIDDEDPGFSQTGEWTEVTRNGFGGDFLYARTTNPESTATWAFGSLIPGTYRVSVTWQPHSNRATNAPFTVHAGSTVFPTTLVNQQVAPSDDLNVGWQTIRTYW